MLLLSGTLNATHLVGGFISYQYVGTSGFGARYIVKITSYRDCKPGSIEFADDIDVCIYNRSDLRLYRTINFPKTKQEKVNPVGRTDCPEATQVCLEMAVFQAQIDLPTSAFGYYVKWEICCRNEQVNLRNDQNDNPFIGQTYQTIIPPTNVKNSSPSFTDVPVPFICINDTTDLVNYAIDPDGDSLVYKLATPWYGASITNNYPGCSPVYTPPVPINPLDYKVGYNGNIPFGANGIAQINSSNGVTTFLARQVGNYAVAIDLFEYRKGVLMSSTRLDMQILVINCTPNNKPTISTGTRNYTIMAGENLCFDVTARDKDNHNISLSGIGDLLTGANGFTGNRATFTNAFGKGTVSSRFCWQTSCAQASGKPYIFTAKAIDDGCPSKFTLVNINITVKPFTGKVTINGPLTVCEGRKGVTYNINTTADTPDELIGVTHVITIKDGTLMAQTANQFTVNWDKGSVEGEITVQPVSRFGCPGLPYVLKVGLLPSAPTPQPQAVDTVCENVTASYNIPPTAAYTYQWWVSNGSILGSSSSNSLSVVWGSPGAAQARVVQYSQNGCPSDTGYVNVWISKPKTPDILGKQSVCPNTSGHTYSVIPAGTGSSFKWLLTGGIITGSASGNAITVNWGNPGSGMVKVLEVNRFGCPGDTVYLPVDITYVLKSDSIQGDTDICEFSLAQVYQVPPSPATVYNWSVSGGTLVSGQGSNRIVVDWGASGTGSISMYETSFDSVNLRNCISSPVSRTINIRPYPVANQINGVFEVCQFSPNGLFTINGYPNSSYFWILDGDTVDTPSPGNNNIILNFDREGTFVLTVVEISEFGCAGNPVQATVIVHPKPRTGPIVGDSIICSPNLRNYPYSVTGFNTSTYNWVLDGGVPVVPGNGKNLNVDWSGQQLNSIKVVEVSDFGCPGDTQKLTVFYDNPYLYLNYITVNPPPRSDNGVDVFWSLRNAPRYNNQMFIEKRAAGSAAAFAVVGTVNGSVVTFNDDYTMNDSNAWEYRVRGIDLCGQPLYSEIHTNILLKGFKTGGYEVAMNFTPYLGWGSGNVRYDLYRMLKGSSQYELYESNITSFRAAYANGLENYTQCYRVLGTKSGSDTVSWSNEICFDFDPVIFIPDAFSPNSDDYNDAFRIKGGALKTVEFYIYNRWGEKLFIGNSINDSWDGTYKGKDQPQDVYMYYCFYTGFDGRKYSTKGTITLLR